MYLSEKINLVDLRTVIRYYRKEARRPGRDSPEALRRDEQWLTAKLVELTGSADCRTPEAWR